MVYIAKGASMTQLTKKEQMVLKILITLARVFKERNGSTFSGITQHSHNKHDYNTAKRLVEKGYAKVLDSGTIVHIDF